MSPGEEAGSINAADAEAVQMRRRPHQRPPRAGNLEPGRFRLREAARRRALARLHPTAIRLLIDPTALPIQRLFLPGQSVEDIEGGRPDVQRSSPLHFEKRPRGPVGNAARLTRAFANGWKLAVGPKV